MVDCIILGQGFAGTALAWALRFAGREAFVIDRGGLSASRAAAGLVTPITGRRLVKASVYDTTFAEARAFYRRIEAELGIPLFRETPMLRLFQSDAECGVYEAKYGPPQPVAFDPDDFATPFGAFKMTHAAQLDAPAYLEASREWYRRNERLIEADVQIPDDIEVGGAGVRLPKLGIEAGFLCFCQGFHPVPNPWFPNIPFQAAQGEILELRIPGLRETRPVHRGLWLAPRGETWLCGATYSWEPFDGQPTPTGRAELETKLRSFLKRPFEVVGHRAAVRPVLRDNRPRAERHATLPLAYLNGLGSKGALHAPGLAGKVVDSLRIVGD